MRVNRETGVNGFFLGAATGGRPTEAVVRHVVVGPVAFLQPHTIEGAELGWDRSRSVYGISGASPVSVTRVREEGTVFSALTCSVPPSVCRTMAT